ncbi:DUF4426 domain-containing protein [Pseudomonas cremoricolorata]|uniref:Homoserine acetyltransferase n=1 Tax=Pseudomonas cremoricolorata TaxID=157783 RepID=A0A089WGX2_9PSED|nr:DUF4426 domain-containing protein [Pseudomonas cremoricolorata]AIR88540.1 homoserine acetyltransferase [Pseudomonas cremoricolorata]
MRGFAAFLLSLCLALPALAADAARPERQQTFDDVTVHYNAFSSSSLPPAVAASTGLLRSKELGVLTVAVRQADAPGLATVKGSVKDLTGRSSPLSFKAISSQGAVSYVAQFKVEQAQLLTFTLDIDTGGVSHTLSFNQEVFPGQ